MSMDGVSLEVFGNFPVDVELLADRPAPLTPDLQSASKVLIKHFSSISGKTPIITDVG